MLSWLIDLLSNTVKPELLKTWTLHLKALFSRTKMGQECYQSIGFPLTLGHWYFVLNLKGIFSLNCKNRFQHINTKSLTYSASWGAFCKLTVAVRVSPLQGFCQYQWTLFHRRIHSWCGHICVGFYSQRYANFRHQLTAGGLLPLQIRKAGNAGIFLAMDGVDVIGLFAISSLFREPREIWRSRIILH